MKTNLNKKVYLESLEYAVEHGEKAAYRESEELNHRCSEFIQSQIELSYNFKKYSLEDTDKLTEKAVAIYGLERVECILGMSIMNLSHDGRISTDNKYWANSVPAIKSNDRKYLTVNVNPGLLDIYVKYARKEIKRVRDAKEYKDYEKINIGDSDYASLILVGPLKQGERLGVLGSTILPFGEDNNYNAYNVVRSEDEIVHIGEHYEKKASFYKWMKIYDDSGYVRCFVGDTINVYRAGEKGCIIETVNPHKTMQIFGVNAGVKQKHQTQNQSPRIKR